MLGTNARTTVLTFVLGLDSFEWVSNRFNVRWCHLSNDLPLSSDLCHTSTENNPLISGERLVVTTFSRSLTAIQHWQLQRRIHLLCRSLHFTICLTASLCFTSIALAEAEKEDEQASTAETTQSEIDPEQLKMLASPRATIQSLIAHINQDDKTKAAQCLDLSNRSTVDAESHGDVLAYRIKATIDRIRWIDFEEIPKDPETDSPYQLGETLLSNYLESSQDLEDASLIFLTRNQDGLWQFSQSTVNAINEIWPRWEDREEIAGLTTGEGSEPPEERLRGLFPASLRHVHFLLPTFQWIFLLILIFLGFIADLLTRFLLRRITSIVLLHQEGEEERKIERKLWRPVGLLVQALVWYTGTTLVDLPTVMTTILLVGLKCFAVAAGVWTGFLLINLLSAYLARQALKTNSKFDDLIVPLMSKSLKVFVVIIGILTCAQTLSFPMAGLLGGTAIGGMALALAAQDAVSNLFGSITVLVDRPFEIGDWIVTGDVEGTVETVGFRSTRIRTFYNSQITVPNSNLTTAIVDNMGRRRYRRIKSILGVQYDTSAAQIDAFCEGIRELIRRHPYTRKDYYHVYFNGFGNNSLNIMLYCFLECPDWAVELREKHRLFVDILELAKRLSVSFAFPTRTLHLYQEEHSSSGSSLDLSNPDLAGQRLAASVTGPLGSLQRRPETVNFLGPTKFDDDQEVG